MKRIYLALTLIGLIVPYYFFITFLVEYGFDLSEIINQLFASQISTFFAVDLIISIFLFGFSSPKNRGAMKWATGGFTSQPHCYLVCPLLFHCSYIHVRFARRA